MTVRVLQVLGRSAGGIATHVAQVAGALDGRRGLEVDIACPPGLPVAMPKPTLEVDIPDGPTGGHIGAIKRLRELGELGSYDVIHAHGLRAGIDAGFARKRGVFGLVTVHNLIHPAIAGAKSAVYARAEPLAVRMSDHALAVSAEIAQRIARGRPSFQRKVEVLYLGVGDAPKVKRRASDVRAELGVGEGRALVVTASRLAPQKALHVMIDAIAGLPNAVLVILGEGPLSADLERQAERRGISDRVRFLGFRADVADFVAAADVFCLSSVWEGVPLSAQEAMLLGTPVVATRVGGMPELIVDGSSGLLVEPNDSTQLALAIEKVAGDKALAASLSGAARQRLSEVFSTERMLDRLEELYSGGADAR